MFSYGKEPQTTFLAPDRSPIELSLFVFKCDANRGASSMESVKTARQLEKPEGLDDSAWGREIKTLSSKIDK